MQTTSFLQVIKDLSTPMPPKPTLIGEVLCPLKDVRAVVFDVYGTLFISGSGDISTAAAKNNAKAFELAAEQAGIRLAAGDVTAQAAITRFTECIEGVHRELHQEGVDAPEVNIVDMWEEVCAELAAEDQLIGVQGKREQYELLALSYECRVNPVWPMPDMEQTLAKLRENLRLGIVSNAQFYTPLLFTALTGKRIDEHGIEPDLCVWSYTEGRAKPSMKLFDRLLERLFTQSNIRPEQVVYVGNDMRNDIWTATMAGCQTVLFAGDSRSLRLREDDERCHGLAPDAVIKDLKRLPQLIS